MIGRINLLVAAGVLVAAALCLVGFYLVVTPIAAAAPGWADHAMGAWVLISLALMVSLLARLHGRLEKSYGPAQRGPQRPLGIAGQGLLYFGHIAMVTGAYRWSGGDNAFLAAAAGFTLLLYAGGITAMLTDWRRRAT